MNNLLSIDDGAIYAFPHIIYVAPFQSEQFQLDIHH